jgi:hypothetical protein
MWRTIQEPKMYHASMIDAHNFKDMPNLLLCGGRRRLRSLLPDLDSDLLVARRR